MKSTFTNELTCLDCGGDLKLVTQSKPRRTSRNRWGKTKVEVTPAAEHSAVLACVECNVQWFLERKLSFMGRPTKELKANQRERKAS